jgi:hypothetical protein
MMDDFLDFFCVCVAGGSSFLFFLLLYLTVRFFHTPSHSKSIRSIRTHKNNKQKIGKRNFFLFFFRKIKKVDSIVVSCVFVCSGVETLSVKPTKKNPAG